MLISILFYNLLKRLVNNKESGIKKPPNQIQYPAVEKKIKKRKFNATPKNPNNAKQVANFHQGCNICKKKTDFIASVQILSSLSIILK